MTDPIADLLARIRNAQTAKHDTVAVPHSQLKQGIVKILYEEGFVGPYKVAEAEGGKKFSSPSVIRRRRSRSSPR